MFNTKKDALPELYELNVDVSWTIFIKKGRGRDRTVAETVFVVPVVYNKDGTKFKDLRTNKIYETGLKHSKDQKMNVMQRMCAMVEPTFADRTLLFSYYTPGYEENVYDTFSIIKQRFTDCLGPSCCKYNFITAPEELVHHSQIQDEPGIFFKDGKTILNAVSELLLTRQQIVDIADNMQQQFEAPERQTKAKNDVLNF